MLIQQSKNFAALYGLAAMTGARKRLRPGHPAPATPYLALTSDTSGRQPMITAHASCFPEIDHSSLPQLLEER